eukprot:CAMPEP_0172526554 /NCGR_PEP_ID=MMETSP1067-20121228/1449_1 /TAXON_ID=265564 ORGANISM="Thalassiosira punctigera, Strain Tpunct2005C2" /NCGR_SAMPLE_ID=MMETSP1067 /ASSEMBLY_ACC=CAM_ASM_000444 /LENGTH=60 /DNA_ID=CAMNT_0013310089 /DNA_START=94 /DNA_END=276 /DNA_ORIENTATION=+
MLMVSPGLKVGDQSAGGEAAAVLSLASPPVDGAAGEYNELVPPPAAGLDELLSGDHLVRE